jgi:hypothetical protein
MKNEKLKMKLQVTVEVEVEVKVESWEPVDVDLHFQLFNS